jgi:hypothetical protein
LQPHCQGWFCNHLYFHQVATTSSKDQSSRNLTVSWHWAFFWTGLLQSHFFTCFLQSQSHCYKGAITLRQGLQSPTFWFATVFFAIVAHQWLQIHCKGCCNHLYFHQVATTSSKGHPSRNLTVSWHGAFFWTGLLQSHFYLFFCNCFFCNRSTSAVATTP